MSKRSDRRYEMFADWIGAILAIAFIVGSLTLVVLALLIAIQGHL